MSQPDFFFNVQLNDEPEFEPMLLALASGVLARAGYAPEAAGEIAASVHSALVRGAAAGRRECRVKFRAVSCRAEVVSCTACPCT